MGIQLRLKGNSEGLILQSKSTYDENWIDRIEIVQEEGPYHLRTSDKEIFY